MAKGKKTGGRKKGQPNKRTQLAIEILEDMAFCPVRKGVYMYRRALKTFEKDKSDFRFKYLEIAQRELQDLRQYAYPKRKAIDLTNNGEAFSLVDMVMQLEAELGKAGPGPAGEGDGVDEGS